jgi:hypothetical protein
MKTSYEALEWYYNNKEALLLYQLDYGNLRKIGFTIKRNRYSVNYEHKRQLFISAVDNEVSTLLEQPFNWLKSCLEERCNKTKIDKDTKKLSWDIAMWLYPYRGKSKYDWWKSYKDIFQIGIDIDWSSEVDAPTPVIVLWIWHNNFDTVDEKILSNLIEKRKTLYAMDGFEAWGIIFGEENKKRKGFVLGEVEITKEVKGKLKILEEEEITNELSEIFTHYQKYKKIIYDIADSVEKKK